MATFADLEAAIDTLLNHPLGIGHYQLVQAVEGKAYEAYVFGLCLKAVRELGVTPVLRGINGEPNPFIFRGGPGQIHSRSSGTFRLTLDDRAETLGTQGITGLRNLLPNLSDGRQIQGGDEALLKFVAL